MAHPVAERALAYFDNLFPVEPTRPKLVSVANPRVSSDILAQIASFSDFGAPTVVTEQDGIRYYVNEYWTAGQRQAHSIHEVSYRACFKPQLPSFFIERLTVPGDVVHDPFMGRGTTPIEAALKGRVASASDINPLSVLLTRPRLNVPSPANVDRWLASLDWDQVVDVDNELLTFYHPQTLRHLTILKNTLLKAAPVDVVTPDPVADWIRMIAINRLTGHSPGFFSVYTLPPNQAVSVNAQRKINQKRGQTPPVRDLRRLINKKSNSLLTDGAPSPQPGANLLAGPADRTLAIADGSIALVVTSPPFLDIVQYADDNWLRCWFAGIDVQAVPIAMHRTESAWENMVRDVLVEQARILRPGGHVAFEVGEVRRGKVLLERLVWSAASGLPYERLGVMVNQQEFTKTANCWGVSNNTGGTNTNRIVLLRRLGG